MIKEEHASPKKCSICMERDVVWKSYQQEGYCDWCYEKHVFPLLDKY